MLNLKYFFMDNFYMNFFKILTFSIIMLTFSFSNAQNGSCNNPPSSIANGTLAANDGMASGDMNANLNPGKDVDDWFVSHGTPSFSSSTPPNGGNNSIYMWSYNNNTQDGEGMYTCLNIESGHTYTIQFKVRTPNNRDGVLFVEAANGLSANQGGNGIQTDPNSQVISSNNINYNDSNFHTVSYTFTANADYKQLQIYPIFNNSASNPSRQYAVQIDNVQLVKADPCDFKVDFYTSPHVVGSDSRHFNDASDGVAGTTTVAWFWDFGDGETSNGQNPVHNYESNGQYDVCLTVIQKNSEGKTCCKQICKSISVFDIVINPKTTSSFKSSDNAEKVIIFPNPAKNRVNVQIQDVDPLDVSLMTINGEVLMKANKIQDGKYSLNINSLASGVYVIRVKSSSDHFNKRLVIE